jgi:hypothetical protein
VRGRPEKAAQKVREVVNLRNWTFVGAQVAGHPAESIRIPERLATSFMPVLDGSVVGRSPVDRVLTDKLPAREMKRREKRYRHD